MFSWVLISFACTHRNKSWSCWRKKFFLQMQKLFSKLSKTFEKWINFPWNVKVFKSIFFFLLFLILLSLSQKFLLAKNCFMEFFLHWPFLVASLNFLPHLLSFFTIFFHENFQKFVESVVLIHQTHSSMEYFWKNLSLWSRKLKSLKYYKLHSIFFFYNAKQNPQASR